MPPFFFFVKWKYLAGFGLFITNFGWSFYLSQIIIIMDKVFDLEYYFTSRLGHVDFIIIHATASFLIMYTMSKKGMLNKKIYLMIGSAGVICSLVAWLMIYGI